MLAQILKYFLAYQVDRKFKNYITNIAVLKLFYKMHKVQSIEVCCY